MRDGERGGEAAQWRSAGPEAEVVLAAFHGSRTPMVFTDPKAPDAPIVALNDAFAELTGHSAAELLGKASSILHGEGTSRDEVDRVHEALAAGQAVEARLLNYRKDGSAFWNAVVISPVRDAQGRVDLHFETHADVTREHDERARDLQAALDQKTALLHEVDHRVKNNLQVISSLILLKARRTADPTTRGALNSMAERIGALSAVHRLLYSVGDVSRFDLKDFVADLAEDLAATVEPERIALSVDVASVAVPASKAAPLALLVHELATNAVRHAFPDGRSGYLSIRARLEDGALRLAVEDNGIGIAAGTPNPEGFGRTLVEMLVRQMRGSIAWDDLHTGTRAAITIPLDAQEAQAA